jgi:hypothetical protein
LSALKWKASNLYSTTNSTETNSTSIIPTSAVTYALAQSINEMGGSGMVAYIPYTFTQTFSTAVTYSNASSTDGVVVVSSNNTFNSSVNYHTIRFTAKQKFESIVTGYDKITQIFQGSKATISYTYKSTSSTNSVTYTDKTGTYTGDCTVYIDDDGYINIVTPSYNIYSTYYSINTFPLTYTDIKYTVYLSVQK